MNSKIGRHFLTAILLVAFISIPAGLAFASSTQPYETIKYRKAAEHVGEIVWVEGKVLRSEKADSGTYLLFNGNKKHLRILIPKSDLKNFEQGVRHYTGKNVKAVGKIAEYGPLLILGVNDPKRIKVVE